MSIHFACFSVSACRLLALLSCAAVAACASNPGGVGSASVMTPVPNTYCNPGSMPEACGSSGNTPARLHCDEATQRWLAIEVCATGLTCWESTSPANPAHKATACLTAPKGTVADAGATDTAGDVTATDVTATDAGDAKSADTKDGDLGPGVDATPGSCGDGACDGTETTDNCPSDCGGQICGDSVCQGTETAESCPADCPAFCGDKVCTPPESSVKCPEDCGNAATPGCTADSDMSLLAEVKVDAGKADAFSAAHTNCTEAMGCLAKASAAAKASCVATCLLKTTKLTANCASCYAAFDVCVATSCATSCADPTDAACKPCVDSKCAKALTSCAAIPIPACPASCEAGKYCDPATGDCITPTCAMPAVWSVDVQKISSWAVSPAGEGCDLNGDGTTDNQMAKILQLDKDANKALQADLVSGKSVTLFEAKQWNALGTAFTIGLLKAQLDPIDAGCNLVSNSGDCAYRLLAANYDVASTLAACPVKATLASTVNGMDLLGTFTGTPVLPVPMLNVPVDVPFLMAQVSGTVVGPASWTVTIDGRWCGAVSKLDLSAAIDKAPEEAFTGAGGKATAKALIINALKPDIDSDGDGVEDAISASFDFGTVPGIITGVTP